MLRVATPTGSLKAYVVWPGTGTVSWHVPVCKPASVNGIY